MSNDTSQAYRMFAIEFAGQDRASADSGVTEMLGGTKDD